MLANIANILTWVLAFLAFMTCAFIAIEALRYITRRL